MVLRLFLLLFLLLLLLVVGCASQVPPPPMPKGDEEVAWLDYYRSMFEIYGDKTLPPRESDSDVAHIAYMKAYKEWNDKEKRKKLADAIVSGCLLGVLINLIIYRVQHKI